MFVVSDLMYRQLIFEFQGLLSYLNGETGWCALTTVLESLACNISDLSVSPQSPTVNLFPIESDLVLPGEGSCYFCNCTNLWLLFFSIFIRYCKQH